MKEPECKLLIRLFPWLIGAYRLDFDLNRWRHSIVSFYELRRLVAINWVKELWCVNDCCSSVKIGCYTSIGIGSSTSVERSLFSIFITMPSHHRINSNRNTFRMFWKQNLCGDELKAKKTWNFCCFSRAGFHFVGAARRHSFEWNCFVI